MIFDDGPPRLVLFDIPDVPPLERPTVPLSTMASSAPNEPNGHLGALHRS
jgi:hypothetical protein